jgi:hypothetical protein
VALRATPFAVSRLRATPEEEEDLIFVHLLGQGKKEREARDLVCTAFINKGEGRWTVEGEEVRRIRIQGGRG